MVVEAVDAHEQPVAGLRLELVMAGGEGPGAVTGRDGPAQIDASMRSTW